MQIRCLHCCRFVPVDLHKRDFCAHCGTDFRQHSPIPDLGKQINDTYVAHDQLNTLRNRTQTAAVITLLGGALLGRALQMEEDWAMGLCALCLGVIVLWRFYVDGGIRRRYPHVFKNENWEPS